MNVWGTLIGVTILAVGISGIHQFGGSFWVEPMFNDVTLLVAIGFAGYAQRKRGGVINTPRATTSHIITDDASATPDSTH